MSVTQSIKNIYKGPFTQYLRISEKIGGVIHEQSKLVDVLFLLEINFLNIVRKYKKPIHEQEENTFVEPISIQIRKVRRVKKYNPTSAYVSHLNLINETVEIFEWVKQTNVEEFVNRVKDNVSPHLTKLKSELLKLDIKHVDWIYSWNEWMEGMARLLVDFHRDGLTWGGTENLPTALLGDIPEIYRKMDHLKLFREINQGENITRILRQMQVNEEQVEEEVEEQGEVEE